MNKHNYKLTDAEFLEILRANSGLYSKTAKAIQKKYNVSYTRQAVMDRAQKHMDVLRQIEDESIETAHLSLIDLMKKSKDPNIRFKSIRFYLQTKGKEQFNTAQPEKPDVEVKEQRIKIGENILRFLTPWRAK